MVKITLLSLWYLHLRKFLETQLNCTFCVEQPCLAKCDGGIFLIHVDDLMFVGDSAVWKEMVLKKFQEQFTISFEQLGEIVMLDRGLALVSSKSARKAVEAFEQCFGKLRSQTTPCDASVLVEDLTSPLAAKDAFSFSSIIGTCLYVTRERPDILYSVKELSSAMSRPTHGALQKLKKLMGCLKATPDYCMVLETPVRGKGKWRSSELTWVLGSFTDADWSSNQVHRRSTSCGIHLLCGCFFYGSSRTQ